jgi:hypothetical protein
MIAITSISPGHKNYESQLNAIKSWIDAGYRVVSMNCKEEIEVLKDEFKDVEFVETLRHNKVLFGKPYIVASALIDYLKTQNDEYNLLINSDIIINGDTEKIKLLSKEQILIMNRGDFETDMSKSKVYELGFDGFFINRKFLDVFPQTILCLGQCFWDYWIPYSAIQAKVKVLTYREPYLFHKMHNAQYSADQWRKTGEIFRAEMGLMNFSKVGQMSDYVFKRIQVLTR